MKRRSQPLLHIFIITAAVWAVYREWGRPLLDKQGVRSSFSAASFSLDKSRAMFLDLGGAPGQKPVVVFVTTWCPVCRNLETALKYAGIPYAKADVENNGKAAGYYEAITAGRTSAVPITVVGTEVVKGFNMDLITSAYRRIPNRTADTVLLEIPAEAFS